MAPLNGSQWDFATRSQNYNYRYPLPSSGAAQTKGPSTFGPVTPQAKTATMYGSVEIAGVAKVIMLSSYIPQVRTWHACVCVEGARHDTLHSTYLVSTRTVCPQLHPAQHFPLAGRMTSRPSLSSTCSWRVSSRPSTASGPPGWWS